MKYDTTPESKLIRVITMMGKEIISVMKGALIVTILAIMLQIAKDLAATVTSKTSEVEKKLSPIHTLAPSLIRKTQI